MTIARALPTTLGAALLALAAALPAAAAVDTRHADFAASQSGLNGSGSGSLWGTNGLSAIFAAFNPALGTLTSFQIAWQYTASFTGTGGEPQGGGGSINFGGALWINAIDYSGDGNSNGGGNGPGLPFAFNASRSPDTTFLVANAGVTYDPALLAAVLAPGTFSVSWKNTLDQFDSFGFSGIADGTASGTGSVDVTFFYDPAGVPEPASLALLGFGALALAATRRRRA